MKYDGSNFFRARIALSLISGKPITLQNIRARKTLKKNSLNISKKENLVENEFQGICEYEAKLLKLVDKLCDDTTIQISADGNELFFKPGFLIGNVVDDTHANNWNTSFNCGKERSISYFLEFLIMVVPFFKNPVRLKLTGITEDEIDNSVYTLKVMSEHFFKTCLSVNEQFLKINIIKRGIKPTCLGEVHFSMENLKKIDPFDMSESGVVNKITGNVFFHNISPIFRNKFLNCVKKNLNIFTPYVTIETECERKDKSEMKIKTKDDKTLPFLTLSLFAHTKNKCLYSANILVDQTCFKQVEATLNAKMQLYKTENYIETDSTTNDESKEKEELIKKKETDRYKIQKRKTQSNKSDIEDFLSYEQIKTDCSIKPIDIYERLGFFISLKILNEVKGLSSIDTNYQWLPLLFMALANDLSVSKITLNILTPHTVMFIRLLADFFKVTFDIVKVEKTKIESSYLIKSVGSCYRNFSKKAI